MRQAHVKKAGGLVPDANLPDLVDVEVKELQGA